MKKTAKKAVVCCLGGSKLKEGAERKPFAGGCAEILTAYPDGLLACASGCLGGGSCVKACRLGAVSIGANNAAVIDRARCVGCGLCVKACPQHIIRLLPAENVMTPRCSSHAKGADRAGQCACGCVGCGVCQKNCPSGAITVRDGLAVIDCELCISCGMCAVKCPRGVIKDANGIFTKAV